MVRRDLKYSIMKRLETLDKWLRRMETLMETHGSDNSQLTSDFYYLSSRVSANMSQIGNHDLISLEIDITQYEERYRRLDRFVEKKFKPLIPPSKLDEDAILRINGGFSRLYSDISK